MKELDKTKVYDLSELTSEELNNVWKYLKKTDEHWYTCPLEEVLNQSKTDRLLFDKHNWGWCNVSKPTANAKELFYTLKNVQVDCRGLTEEAHKETSNKLNYELDFNFITQLAERMAQNKHKYEPYNWQKLDNIEDLKQALYRHVMEVMKGNYEDDNRLFGHLESIALNAMFINYQLNNK